MVREWMRRYRAQFGPVDLWVLGGAMGVDTDAEGCCRDNDWPHAVLYPLYARYGQTEAPKRRNLDMVAMVAASRRGTFLAFPQRDSRGTYHCMTAAKHVGLTLYVAMPTHGGMR